MAADSPRVVRARVERNAPVARDVREVALRLLERAALPFRPGQYADFRIRNSRGEVEERGFSIASGPEEPGLLFAAKTRSGGLASGFFRSLGAGDEVELRAPLGRFALSEERGLPRLFVATGTGVAPFRPMVRHLLARGERAPVTLLFGVRSEEDVFWEDEFRALERAHANFRFRLTLSRPADGWSGLRGRVTDYLGAEMSEPGKVEVYVCGRPAIVEAVSRSCVGRGLPSGRLRRDPSNG